MATRIFLLREILERNFLVTRKAILHGTSHGLYATGTDGKGNDRTNYNAADSTKCNSFKEHTIPKKCHLRHLFYAKLLQIHNCLGLAPKALKLIIFALFWSEDMHNNATKVQKDPA